MKRSRTKTRLAMLASALAAIVVSGCVQPCLRIDPSGEHLFVYDPPPAAASAVTCPPGTVPTPAAIPAPPPTAVAPAPVVAAPATGLQPIPVQPAPVPQPVSPYSDVAVTLRPGFRALPVGAEAVLVAGVLGGDNYLRTNRRLDWWLAPNSVGEFTEIGEGHFEDILVGDFTRARIISSKSAVSTTSRVAENAGQGGAYVASGENWIALRSPIEGVSQVTVGSPSVVVPAARTKTATIYWYDAQYNFPEPVVTQPGTKGMLTTTVWKLTTRCPLSGWIVRYELTGGPQAIFVPSGSTAVEVPTDAAGHASVEIVQREPAAGTSQVRVQLFHPPAQCNPQFLVRDGVTAVSWCANAVAAPAPTAPSAPAVAPTLPGPVTTTPPPSTAPPVTVGPPGAASPANTQPPAAVSLLELNATPQGAIVVGSTASFGITVTNRGTTAALGVKLLDRFDPGLELNAATSPVFIRVGDLAPGETRQQSIAFHVTRAGRLCQHMEVVATDGGRATQDVCVNAQSPAPPIAPVAPPVAPITPPAVPTPNHGNVTPPPTVPGAMPLAIRAAAAAATATVGQAVVFTATIENISQQPVQDVTFVAQPDATLKVQQLTEGAKQRGSDFVWNVPAIPAGRTVKLQVQCECRQVADSACCRFNATLAGGQAAQTQACLQITPGNPLRGSGTNAATTSRLNVLVDNRNIVSAGKVQQFVVQVSNEGDAAENDVALTVRIPAGTTLANDGTAGPDPSIKFQQQPGMVSFDPVAELAPGRRMNYRVNVVTSRSGPISLQAEVTSRRQSQPVQGSATVEVLSAE